MEILTTAIIAAIGDGLKDTGKTAIKDAYQALKKKLISVIDHKANIEKAIHDIEEKPTSQELKLTLNEELIKAQVDKNADIITLLNQLLDQLPNKESDNSNSTNITKTYKDNAVDMSGGTFNGDINFNRN